MREAFRRPTGDGVLDAMLELLAPAFDPLPRFSADIGSSTPPLSSPGPPRIPPSRPQISSLLASFGLQNRFQNFTRFLIAFWLPKCSQKPADINRKCIKNAPVFSLRVQCVFLYFFESVLVAFPAARPWT